MKQLRVGALLLVLASAVFASDPKASDFDTSFVVEVFEYQPGNDCLMNLKAGSTNYDVRWHYSEQQIRGGCPAHHSGEHLQGRVKGGIRGYRIEMLGVNSKGKPTVETWYITSQVQ
jgi:hypothetical protein